MAVAFTGLLWCLGAVGAVSLQQNGQVNRHQATSNASVTRAAYGPSPAAAPMPRTVFRPHLESGEPEIVTFGILCRSVSDINLKRGTFFADVVVTLRWTDPQAAQLCRSIGERELTLSKEAAQSRMWLPDVSISNRAAKGVETVSTWIHMKDDGQVTKVERMLATVSNEYGVHAFPFDNQSLVVQIGSASMMLEELEFKASEDAEASGVSEGMADMLEDAGFGFTQAKTLIVQEYDYRLKKSRGELHIEVQRRSLPYIQCLLLPELLVLAISSTVFWFPQTVPFVMPRVATAIISFLALTTLGLRTNSMLPVRGGLSWIDLFETCCMTLMFFTVGLNIFVMVLYHSLQVTTLATTVDSELKFLVPISAGIMFFVCFQFTHGEHLALLAMAVNNGMLVVILGYLMYCWFRLSKDEEYMNNGNDKS